jgi:hypothetical protein
MRLRAEPGRVIPNGARAALEQGATQDQRVDINALRALAPPSLRPRSQAVRPPGPHAAAPLEPQAQPQGGKYYTVYPFESATKGIIYPLAK